MRSVIYNLGLSDRLNKPFGTPSVKEEKLEYEIKKEKELESGLKKEGFKIFGSGLPSDNPLHSTLLLQGKRSRSSPEDITKIFSVLDRVYGNCKSYALGMHYNKK